MAATRDLARTMQKAAARNTEKSRPPVFQEAPKAYPHRLTLDMTAEDYDTIRDLAHEHRLNKVELLRRLVARLRQDPALAADILTSE